MVRIAPFPAVYPAPGFAARVASLPYDVVTTDEARLLAADNPHSFLRVVRSEIEFPGDSDPYADAVYEKARANYERLLSEGALERDEDSCIWLYRQVRNHVAQIGIVCRGHVDDYEQGFIKRHEHTRPVKEDDRTKHVLRVGANTGPVFLTYRDDETITKLVEHDINERPIHHFVANDGVTHTVWRASNAQPYIDAFAQVPATYVADGHHRAASAARAAAERRAANPEHTGDEPYNWFLTALFPASSLTILPYHRVLLDLGDLDGAGFLERLRSVGTVTPVTDPDPGQPASFCVYVDGSWHHVAIDEATVDRADPVGSLDVALLQDRVLAGILGIDDPRTDPRIDFVGGIRGTGELARRVDAGEAAAAISMNATSIESLLAVADAGDVMPPKSTWFEPKLRSGLFVHEI